MLCFLIFILLGHVHCSKDDKLDKDLIGIWAKENLIIEIHTSDEKISNLLEKKLEASGFFFQDTIQFTDNSRFLNGWYRMTDTSPATNRPYTGYEYVTKKNKVHITPDEYMSVAGESARYEISGFDTLKLIIDSDDTGFLFSYLEEEQIPTTNIHINNYKLTYTFKRLRFYTN